jgi:hypothetical protein
MVVELLYYFLAAFIGFFLFYAALWLASYPCETTYISQDLSVERTVISYDEMFEILIDELLTDPDNRKFLFFSTVNRNYLLIYFDRSTIYKLITKKNVGFNSFSFRVDASMAIEFMRDNKDKFMDVDDLTFAETLLVWHDECGVKHR